MEVRRVHLRDTRAKHAVIRRIPSSIRPRRAAYFADGITPGYHSWPPLWPRGAVLVLVKTRNQLIVLRTYTLIYPQAYNPPMG